MIFPSLILNIERWKYNKEFKVYVSNMGHIKNQEKQDLPIKLSQNGYCKILTPYGFKSVHRLVLLTWKPIPNAEDLTVDHLNHNKRDNSLKNLEWVTKAENSTRADQDQLISDTLLFAINDIPFYSIEKGLEILCTIYPSGYSEDIFKKAIRDMRSGRNPTGSKKLGTKAILKIIN